MHRQLPTLINILLQVNNSQTIQFSEVNNIFMQQLYAIKYIILQRSYISSNYAASAFEFSIKLYINCDLIKLSLFLKFAFML